MSDTVNEVDNDGDEGNMKWPAFNPYFKYLRESKNGNFIAMCKLCPPGEEAEKSCAETSNSNLKLHLKRVHRWTDIQLNSLNAKSKGVKRKASGDHVETANSGAEAGSNFFKKRRITQKDVDSAVLNLVINERLPYRIVDSPDFRHAVLLGCPENLTICGRQTFATRLSGHHDKMVEGVTKELADVPYLCTTADAWSKYRKSYLGMTCTWLHPKTMQRGMVALAVRRLRGQHTYKRLATAMKKIHEKFQLKPDKIRKTITDSGSNFVKAFKDFGKAADADCYGDDEDADDAGADAEDAVDEATNTEIAVDDFVPVEIGTMLDVDLQNFEDFDVELPSHQRCAAHILNLLGSTDTKAALERNAAYKKIHDQTDEKLRTCWRRQNKSTLVAEAIHSGLGVKLQIPGETRWNSEYDAKAQIVKILDGVDGDEKFARTLEAAGLPKFTATEAKYLREFVWVMGPVATALDILQRDKNMYMGYLLPTIMSLESQLRFRREREGKALKYCEPLIRTLLEAIRKPRRFETYMNDRELQIAACLVPRFKLDWITDDKIKAECKAQIAREMSSLSPSEAWCSAGGPAPSERSDTAEEDLDNPERRACDDDNGEVREVAVDNERSFEDSFYGVAHAPLVEQGEEGEESAAQELERYLLAPRSGSVEDYYAVRPCGTRMFPRLAQMFLKYNVGLPSSASVERLFWQAGISFRDLRSTLSDNNLECEVLLRVNRKFWHC